MGQLVRAEVLEQEIMLTVAVCAGVQVFAATAIAVDLEREAMAIAAAAVIMVAVVITGAVIMVRALGLALAGVTHGSGFTLMCCRSVTIRSIGIHSLTIIMAVYFTGLTMAVTRLRLLRSGLRSPICLQMHNL